ncbi:hypothetical protein YASMINEVIRUS_1015 [Yasminevirus sp. GU-2018]|uniref:TLC domain-containing protein n=1 Tax=Yasminevirus sp. GU-2018 TaxID=2420051 RepID=A0A5K0UAM0_9VIRU|nr:hypothetical protein YASMINEVIRUS_1015 [Yasminevirus sp. GU-2018]
MPHIKNIITFLTSVLFAIISLLLFFVYRMNYVDICDFYFIFEPQVYELLNVLYGSVLSYMTYDTIRMFVAKDVKYDLFIHHLFVGGCILFFWINDFLHHAVVSYLLYEIPNIPLAIMNFKTSIRFVNDRFSIFAGTFALLFFIVRIVYGSFLTYECVNCIITSGTITYIAVLLCGFHLLNIFWFFKIVIMITKRTR